MDTLIQDIKDFYAKNDQLYFDISSEVSTKKIHNLIFNDIFSEPDNADEYFNYGKYFTVKKDYDNAIKYYLMAVEKGNINAMNSAGHCYEDNDDYENMMRYYLMGVERNNSNAMTNLGNYYENKGDYKNMMKYYLMAIEKDNSYAMNNLGNYYKKEGDYKNMMKYYLMAIEKDNSYAMNGIGYHYQKEGDYENMMKYYLMGIERNNSYAMNNLGAYYMTNKDCNNAIKYYLMAIENNNITAISNLNCHYNDEKDYYNLTLLHYNNRFTIGKEEDIATYFKLYLTDKENDPFDNDILKVIKDNKECYEIARDWAHDKGNMDIINQIMYHMYSEYYKVLLLLKDYNNNINNMSNELLHNILYLMN